MDCTIRNIILLFSNMGRLLIGSPNGAFRVVYMHPILVQKGGVGCWGAAQTSHTVGTRTAAGVVICGQNKILKCEEF